MTHTRQFKIGLIICALLGIIDVVSIASVGSDDGPPTAVIVIGLVLGLITLVGVRLAWRGDDKGFTMVVVSRVLSALTGIPAFFADDAPDWAPVAVGIGIVATAVGLGLLYVGRRQPASVR